MHLRILHTRIEPWLERLRPLRALAGRILQSAVLLYDLRREPRTLLMWVKTRARSHVIFIVSVALLGIGLSLTSHFLLQRMFSQKSFTEKITGMLGAQSRDERRRESARRAFDVFLCVVGVGVIGSRLLLDLRATVGTRIHKPRPSGAGGSRPVGDRYHIQRQLGRGASGTVHLAEDGVLDRQVALKELKLTGADEDSLARFRREAKILARLNHPNIVQVYDMLEQDGRVWIAMELVSGGDLARMLERDRRLLPVAVARLAELIAEALAFAHNLGIVHRDIKPLNILLFDDETPKITDFGLAKLSEGNVHTIEGAVFGSPLYISPEQAEGRPVDGRSDIYSLGAVLYHMLSGSPPFSGDTRSILMQHVRRPAAPLRNHVPDAPATLTRLVMQMLAKEPGARPDDMTVVARRLRRAGEALPSRT